MTAQELTEKIENGSDILFDVMGRHFGIFTWPNEGIGIDERAPHSMGMRYYKSAEELISSFTIDGKPLADIADQVMITDYT